MNSIKEIIEKKIGISTIDQYNKYKAHIWDNPVSMEEIEELSPDKINGEEFWKYCDENPEFKYDTVAFGISKTGTIEDVNRNNFIVSADSGVFSKIIMYRDFGMNVLDIGAGFGMLRDELRRYVPHSVYYGVDVHPKFEGCLKVTDCILPPEIMNKRFGFVIATNVFQHLSSSQHLKYYEQISKILDNNGYFVVTHMIDVPNRSSRIGFRCKDNDRRYAVHYGQFVLIPTFDEVVKNLNKFFTISSFQQRFSDNNLCFNVFLNPTEQQETK